MATVSINSCAKIVNIKITIQKVMMRKLLTICYGHSVGLSTIIKGFEDQLYATIMR